MSIRTCHFFPARIQEFNRNISDSAHKGLPMRHASLRCKNRGVPSRHSAFKMSNVSFHNAVDEKSLSRYVMISRYLPMMEFWIPPCNSQYSDTSSPG